MPLLSARWLNDCQNVNSYEMADVAELSEGDTQTLYFQLIDINLDKAIDGHMPAGRRYITAPGATLQCVIENIDDAKKITRYATVPFSNDTSIWKISILSTDQIRGTSNLRLTLTEGVEIKHGVIKSGIRVHSSSCL